MALTPGTRIGSYEVTAQIGAGGMGEVYRATDTTLKRQVAIKILPDTLAADPERLARFQREAEVLAALNHPNIAHIYGLERSDGTTGLVMELVEGPTLADRIAQGPIPVDEALAIAKQIAEALEAAHEQGIVHRDLKPANVKVRLDGTVKVLDFGLAKAMDPASGPRASADQSLSPTITTPAMTHAGMILGTAAYMSPEQALGKPVDRRADIWAFGCVLYEVLTGTMAFRGEVVAETLAAVIRADPDWQRLPPATPWRLGALVRRCLKKDVRQRLQAIGDARIELDEARSGQAEPLAAARAPRIGWVTWVAVGIATAVIAATTGLVAWRLKPAPVTPREVSRQTILLPPGQRLAETRNPILALSPDDRYLAYVATQPGEQRQLYLWSFEQGAARVVPGSVGADTPFFSRDGQWLGFYNGQNRLMKIPVRGGIADPLLDVVNPFGVSWVGDRRIAVASLGTVIQEPSVDGRTLQALTRFDSGEVLHEWPEFLPGNDALLFNVASNRSSIVVQRLGGDDDRRVLIEGADKLMPRYSPSGHVIYAQAGNLMALPFDLTLLEMPEKAVPTPVMSGIQQIGAAPLFALSTAGSLVYVPGEFEENRFTLVQVGRDGKEQRTFGAPPRSYYQPRLSPDGRRVALDVFEGGVQVWVYDLLRDRIDPFTYGDERDNRHGLWTPDSSRLVYQSGKDGTRQIFSRPAEGGESEKLTSLTPPAPDVDTYTVPNSFCRDGRLIFTRLVPSAELWQLEEAATSGSRPDPVRLNHAMSADGAPVLSPDCRWLAYVLDESGRREVYVQTFPGLESRRQISTDGGTEPMWNPDPATGELFYRSGEDMMAIRLDDRGFASGTAEKLFSGPYTTARGGYARPNYDVFPDGSFLMLKPVERQPLTQINVVLGWSEELKRLAPTN